MEGHVLRGSILGDVIYEMCKQEDISTIVEIGTYNGLGTTKCIYDSIIDSDKKNYHVYSIESNERMYNTALSNLNKIDNFDIIHGRIIEIDEIIDIDDLDDTFFRPGTDRSAEKSWRYNDVEDYKNTENIINTLPEKIDLLILDGGEFSSLSEFKRLEDRFTYLILDDTLTIKNREVAKIIRENNNTYEVIIDSSDRNGYLVCKKIKINK
jgi:tRNA A58 N-methylase Trm61